MAPPPATVGATAARGPAWPRTPGTPAPGPRPGPDVRPAMRPHFLLPVVALLPATAAPSPLLDATWLNAILECPFVRRAKAALFSGCNSHPATFAPAGSNRSGSGGNETAEAFDAKGRQAAPRAGRP